MEGTANVENELVKLPLFLPEPYSTESIADKDKSWRHKHASLVRAAGAVQVIQKPSETEPFHNVSPKAHQKQHALLLATVLGALLRTTLI